jgi:hypothetical protein
MSALSVSGNAGSAISPENRDPLFRDHAENAGFGLVFKTPKKEARPKGPGTPLLRRNIVSKGQKTMSYL